ncbi:MAG: hypothetical protein ACRDRJ_27185 [Streptosporangiaceae bacterium]
MTKPRGSTVTSSSLGTFSPTFVGTAATGCASGCNLLTGPFATPSTASFAVGSAKAKAAARAARAGPAAGELRSAPDQGATGSASTPTARGASRA